MRSYSTLLSHVLGNNKDIDGYSELHYSYLNQLDGIKAKIQIMYTLGGGLSGKYILDKLLHNENQISESFLQENTVKLIFLLRNPLDTYKSRINMLVKNTMQNKDPKIIHNYYVSRLKMLIQQAKSLNTSKIFIDSEQIKTNTDATLDKLSEFLELEDVLTSNYQLFKYSGNGTYGDSTDNIKKRVISTNSNSYNDIIIPEKILEEANSAYIQGKKQLFRLCNI